MSYDIKNRVLLTYSSFLKILLGMEESHKKSVDSVQACLLNMSEQE